MYIYAQKGGIDRKTGRQDSRKIDGWMDMGTHGRMDELRRMNGRTLTDEVDGWVGTR